MATKNIHPTILLPMVAIIFFISTLAPCSLFQETTIHPEALTIDVRDDEILTVDPTWSTPEVETTMGIAWGDYDNDGDLDLATGNFFAPNRLYRNNGTGLDPVPVWISNDALHTTELAWGDINNDGFLDLVVANGYDIDQYNCVYFNTGTTLEITPSWRSEDVLHSTGMTLGDYDNDGYLDLAVAATGNSTNIQKNVVYRNIGGTFEINPSWESGDRNWTSDLEWGDFDGDGDLDLAASNIAAVNVIYENDNGVLLEDPIWTSEDEGNSQSVAWGDVDGDGDFDLAVANSNLEPNTIYINNNGVLETYPSWESTNLGDTWVTSWADIDNDGDLDMLSGEGSVHLYENTGTGLQSTPVWASNTYNDIRGIVMGDVDRDGDLDMIMGTADGPNYLFENNLMIPHMRSYPHPPSWSQMKYP